MKITLDETHPIETYPYLEVGTGSSIDGQPIIINKDLPIYLGEFEKTDTPIDFLIICADLQGMVEVDGTYSLLGEVLPEFLKLLIDLEWNTAQPPNIGVCLCGDLYTSLEKRGASGDVRKVWLAFLKYFKWVVGVAGNHDRFGDAFAMSEFKTIPNISLLHKEIKVIDNLRIGGISGIIGRADKTHRVDEKEYLNTLKKLTKKELDFLLLHETPGFPSKKLVGNTKIRATIEKSTPTTVCSGHCHWEQTLITLANQSRVLNVDAKVVILKNIK